MRYSAKKTVLRTLCVLFIIITLHSQAYSAEAVINISQKHQKMEGFGAALAFYQNWLAHHPNKSDVYNLIFDGLGLDILRVANWYGHSDTFQPYSEEFVQEAENSLGYPVKILMSCWSPPAYLKSNNDTKNGGTLKKDAGEYMYQGYADYWHASLLAYRDRGVVPDWISIQNEPDWSAGWESCLFEGQESNEFASYGKSLQAVYDKLQTMENPPKMIGPENLGIGYNRTQEYTDYLNPDYLDGIAHHLYHGGDPENPDSYIASMSQLKTDYSDLPRLQTEFSGGNWLQTAWLIHNSLVYEEVTAYVYWYLAWGFDASTGQSNTLISLDNPWASGQWRNNKGYVISHYYYAFKQYSKFIYSGWRRIGSSINNDNLKITAFLSPAVDTISVVVLNTGYSDESVSFSFSDAAIETGQIYQTTSEIGCRNIGSFSSEAPLSSPAQSITTLQMSLSGTEIGPAKGRGMQYSGSNNAISLVPGRSGMTIRADGSILGNYSIDVYDMNGQKIAGIFSNKNSLNMHIIKCSNGCYQLVVKAGDRIYCRKAYVLQ